jgi:hypothetical protein
MTRKYIIPCSWELYGEMEVEADSLEEAVTIAESDESGLPEGTYVEASFRVDHDVMEELNEQVL